LTGLVSSLTPSSPSIDSGLICFVMVCRFHNTPVDPDQLSHEYKADGRSFDQEKMVLAAKRMGLKAKVNRIPLARLEKCPLPAIGTDQAGNFFIIVKAQEDRVLIQDPLTQRPQLLSRTDFGLRWTGDLVLFTSRAFIGNELKRFDFTWFIPAIIKYRRLLGEVLIVSFALQVFGLMTPLFFQVVMDKVLVHRGWSTLNVISFGLLVVSIFSVALTALRSYVFSHTTSRIDVELGARLFRHLVNLPLSYFKARRVGDSVARVRELENIRSFLTGNAITVVLDLVFSVLFILVMFFYSRSLTFIVVGSLPLYLLLSLSLTPALRHQLHEKFNRGAENQAFLVEAISGIETLKASVVEPQMRLRWDNQLAAYVKSGFRTATLSALGNAGVSLVGKLVTVATLWLGARLVIEGKMTVGQLIAFNMLSGQVSQPILRIAQLWTDFQQVGISMQRLGDILRSPMEGSNTSRSTLPTLKGSITFEQVSFRYRPDGSEVLRNLDLKIAPSEHIGIVGRSGSGKSTLAKLIQRLFIPERGRVLIDGIDLAIADASSLRRQIGVVLQENVLFRRTIRENIALADPGAPIERVMGAAKLAGAHEFILEQSEGYDTLVEEHGSSLSGGQRQRIAIARAILTNPRILIFDEATSALDYESERIIQQNMQAICRGRTVIVIAHRLSAVRNAHRIIVLEKGQIVEQGPHDVLMANSDGIYSKLYRMQKGEAL
jgi:subfamily B ATP-binding cassette protein HlyB/CyaB